MYFIVLYSQDINREVDQLKFDLQDLERWRDRILTAIHMGEVVNVSKLIC